MITLIIKFVLFGVACGFAYQGRRIEAILVLILIQLMYVEQAITGGHKPGKVRSHVSKGDSKTNE